MSEAIERLEAMLRFASQAHNQAELMAVLSYIAERQVMDYRLVWTKK